MDAACRRRRVAAYSMTNNGSGHPNSYSYKQTNKQTNKSQSRQVKSSPVQSSPVGLVNTRFSFPASPSPLPHPFHRSTILRYVTLRLSCHRIESNRIESNRIESNRIESNRIESNRIV
jgi:hypothetical protein